MYLIKYQFVASELVQNHECIQLYEMKRNIDRLGKPVDKRNASGEEISFRAFKKIIKAQHLDSKQNDREFFIQLVKTWRDKLRKDYQLLLIDKDSHPPSEFRANGIVKNFDEFHNVFNTKPGDFMYMPADKRIHIW